MAYIIKEPEVYYEIRCFCCKKRICYEEDDVLWDEEHYFLYLNCPACDADLRVPDEEDRNGYKEVKGG